MARRETVVYYAGWKCGSPRDLPWDAITYVNHAFYAVRPADGSCETSFDRRDANLPPREKFEIVPLCESTEPRNLAAYAEMHALHPDTTIMISIGGWTRCGYFSEMAYTKAGRASFIESCLALIEEHPWIGGIDLDWEYPAGTVHGERRPDGNDGDEGCPIYGTAEEDSRNFCSLIAELHCAMDERWGIGAKRLTACASGSVETTLPCVDWSAASVYLDLINIMTYDLCGVWDGFTGHSSAAADAVKAAEWFKTQGIKADKLCLGSPLYGSVFVMNEPAGNGLNAPCERTRPAFELRQGDLRAFAETEGWHTVYDEEKEGAYMYNDDPSSRFNRWFVSYENERSLRAKLRHILERGYAGIIVWESTQDTPDYKMIKLMHEILK